MSLPDSKCQHMVILKPGPSVRVVGGWSAKERSQLLGDNVDVSKFFPDCDALAAQLKSYDGHQAVLQLLRRDKKRLSKKGRDLLGA